MSKQLEDLVQASLPHLTPLQFLVMLERLHETTGPSYTSDQTRWKDTARLLLLFYLHGLPAGSNLTLHFQAITDVDAKFPPPRKTIE